MMLLCDGAIASKHQDQAASGDNHLGATVLAPVPGR